MFSCAELFSRLLCWGIYWCIMWFSCGFEYIAKNHHRVYIYIVTVTGICVGSHGKVKGLFFCQPVATLVDPAPGWYSASVCAIINVISYYIRLHCNGTPLSFYFHYMYWGFANILQIFQEYCCLHFLKCKSSFLEVPTRNLDFWSIKKT